MEVTRPSSNILRHLVSKACTSSTAVLESGLTSICKKVRSSIAPAWADAIQAVVKRNTRNAKDMVFQRGGAVRIKVKETIFHGFAKDLPLSFPID